MAKVTILNYLNSLVDFLRDVLVISLHMPEEIFFKNLLRFLQIGIKIFSQHYRKSNDVKRSLITLQYVPAISLIDFTHDLLRFSIQHNNSEASKIPC